MGRKIVECNSCKLRDRICEHTIDVVSVIEDCGRPEDHLLPICFPNAVI